MNERDINQIAGTDWIGVTWVILASIGFGTVLRWLAM